MKKSAKKTTQPVLYVRDIPPEIIIAMKVAATKERWNISVAWEKAARAWLESRQEVRA